MLKKLFIPSGLILAAAFLAAAAEAGSRVTQIDAGEMNLLVITIDTMRADRIGAYGYSAARTPNLDDLAKNGIMFTDCYSPVPLTLPAHCSLFTGRYPLGHRVRDNGTFFLGEAETTLAETMIRAGYDTYAVIASFVLMAKFGLNQGFSVYDDSLNADELLRNFYSEIPADTVYAKFHQWFENHGKKKFFAWVHFYDPHLPYDPPEEFRGSGDSPMDLYDGEVAFTDFHVGKILEDLVGENVLDDTLIVVVGDHGEAFGEHGEYGHSVFCYEENLKIPLIFSNPRLFPKGSVVEDRVCLIDIMPTLLEIFGLDSVPSLQGQSLSRMIAGKKERADRSYYIESMYGKESLGWAPLAGIIDGPYKYISLPEPELYDLKNDIGERNNLVSAKTGIVRAMDEKLKKIMLEYAVSGGNARRELTAEDRKRLESLGYISSSSPGAGRFLDPKKGIVWLNNFNDANNLIEEGRLDVAEAELRKIAAQNTDIAFLPYYELMAKIFEMKSDPEAVIQIWREAVDTFPANERFRTTLAFKLFQEGQWEEAEALGLEITRMDDKSSSGFILLGRIEEARGNDRKALEHFQKALDLEPNNTQLKLSFAQSLVKNGRQDRALTICREIFDDRAVKGDPGYAGILARIGIIYIEANRIDRAREVLLEAVTKDDSDAEAWNNLGIAYYREKDYPKAVEAYEHAVRLNAQFASAFNNLGTLYLRSFLERKDADLVPKAIAAFDQAIQNDRRLASAYNGRASAFKFTNRPDEAIRDWKKAIELQPDFVDVYFNLGITYLETGNKAGALQILEVCKKRFYSRLSPNDRGRLDRLIAEATR
jgi:arylsulfatase A-like enzyme/Flp pilus assembly protein TadD